MIRIIADGGTETELGSGPKGEGTPVGIRCSPCEHVGPVDILLGLVAIIGGYIAGRETARSEYTSKSPSRNRLFIVVGILLAVLIFMPTLFGGGSTSLIIIGVCFAIGFLLSRSVLNYDGEANRYHHQVNRF